jgi:hypothetical protein
MSRLSLPAAAQKAGSASRPVFNVMSASLRPLPSSQSRFSRGTFTPVKRSTPFERPLRPMKEHLCTTSTPGESVSTMNAVIGFLFEPFSGGVRAITTMMSARGPLVVQSFSPFRTQWVPSADSSAVVDMFAGSEPTSFSVSANADSAPFANRGRYFFFCSSVPNFISGPGTPMLWCADRKAPVDEQREPTMASART